MKSYGKRYAIETAYNNKNTSQAIRVLAGYIGVESNPQNIEITSISMTTLVVTSSKKENPKGTSI